MMKSMVNLNKSSLKEVCLYPIDLHAWMYLSKVLLWLFRLCTCINTQVDTHTVLKQYGKFFMCDGLQNVLHIIVVGKKEINMAVQWLVQ